MTDAAISSNTPVTDYMDMKILRFYETWEAICNVYQKREQRRKRAADNAKRR